MANKVFVCMFDCSRKESSFYIAVAHVDSYLDESISESALAPYET